LGTLALKSYGKIKEITAQSMLNEKNFPDELEHEEKAWEQFYLTNRDHFRKMARQALSDLDAGKVLEMASKN
jgi:hypothetical protein